MTLRIFTRAGSPSALNTCAVASASSSASAGVPSGRQESITRSSTAIATSIVSTFVEMSNSWAAPGGVRLGRLCLDADGLLEDAERLVLAAVVLEERRELLVRLHQVPARMGGHPVCGELVDLDRL